MSRWRRPPAISAGLLLAALAGCGTSSPPPPPGAITFLIESAPLNLDPRFGADAQSQDLDGLLFSSLVAHDAHMNVVPDAAQSWESPDPLTYVFHLKPAIRFADGRPLTSADVKYTFDSILGGVPSANGPVRSPKRGSFDKIASIDAPDPATVVFHLAAPRASFLWDMSRPAVGIVPQGAGTEIKQHPIGSGPFRFVSQTPDADVVLERNPYYFAAASAGASGDMAATPVERIDFRVVPEAVVRALELRKGSADIGGVNSLAPDMVAALAADPKLTVADQPGTSLTYVAFNLTDPILARREVRQALDYATDRDSIIRYLLRGQARAAAGQLPPGNWAADPSLAPRPYDPAEANRLLDAAGFPRGPDGVRLRLALKTSTEEPTRLLAETLADQWKQVGVALEIRPLESATFFSDINHGSFQMYTLRWLGVNNDPAFFPFAFSANMRPPNGYNRGRYRNPALETLFDQLSAEPDREKQKALAWQIEKILAEDDPYLNLWFNDVVCVYNRRLTGVELSPTGDYNFLETLRVSR